MEDSYLSNPHDKFFKESFIDKELSEHFSDILYKIKLSEKPCYIYLLFEHKSYIDPWTGFQLLRNMVKIWEQYFKQNKTADKLPVILPIIKPFTG
jgi:predicted transposase/invertase (TIGR01784 family)